MGNTLFFRPESTLALFAPPYESFQSISTTWSTPLLPPRGLAIIWWLHDGNVQEQEFEWLWNRPRGLSLFIVLPPARQLERAMPLLEHVLTLNAQAVLPSGPIISPVYLRELLSRPPQQLADAVAMYLLRRRLLRTDEIRREVQRILECVPEIRSISRLARRLYTSRRTLGRHFAAAGLPVPSHWLQFGRLLYAVVHLQREKTAVFRIASRAGYPDGFTMSNQMKRLLGCRPTEVRNHLGWEWIVEAWIQQETKTGGIDLLQHREAVAMYLTGDARQSGDDMGSLCLPHSEGVSGLDAAYGLRKFSSES